MQDLAGPSAPGRSEKRFLWLLPFEIGACVAIFYADSRGWVPLSKTPFLLLVGWISLWVRGIGWRSIGLRFGEGWKRLAMLGVLAGIGFWLFEYFVENPLLHALTGRYPDLSDFADLTGNLTLLLIILAANIVLAGFGEEMFWRGYALSRLGEAMDTRMRWVIALLVSNAAFGLAHLYQGESGTTQAAVQGVLLGILYLRTGRSLVAPIVAHTVANTCDFALIYLGHHVGVTGQFPF